MLERNFFSRITNLSPSVQQTLLALNHPGHQELKKWVEDNTNEGMPVEPVLERLSQVPELVPILGSLSASDLWDTIIWVGQLSKHPTPEERLEQPEEMAPIVKEVLAILEKPEHATTLTRFDARIMGSVPNNLRLIESIPEIQKIHSTIGDVRFLTMMHYLAHAIRNRGK